MSIWSKRVSSCVLRLNILQLLFEVTNGQSFEIAFISVCNRSVNELFCWTLRPHDKVEVQIQREYESVTREIKMCTRQIKNMKSFALHANHCNSSDEKWRASSAVVRKQKICFWLNNCTLKNCAFCVKYRY